MNEQKAPTPAKKGTVLYKTRISIWRILSILIRIIVNNIISGILIVLFGAIPIVGWILIAWITLSNLFNILELILYCCVPTKITTTGICGLDDTIFPFDIPASHIYGVSHIGRKVYIEGCLVGKKGIEIEYTWKLRIPRAEEFVQAYRDNRIKMIIEE